jgi:hypothetical protein
VDVRAPVLRRELVEGDFFSSVPAGPYVLEAVAV